MPRFSRTTVLAAVTVTAAVALTGCSGSGSGGSDSKALSIYIGGQPNFPTEWAAYTADLKAKFKAKTGADLTIDTYASSADETTKIQSSVVAGTGPDVYQLGSTFTPVAYSTKGFMKLTDADWQKIGGRDRFIPETLGMSGPDKQNEIGIPQTMAPFGLIYNTEMFKKAGITTTPKTWDEFVATATKLNNPAAGVYGTTLSYADGFSPWKYIWAMTEQQGGSFVSSDLKSAGLSSDQVLKATTGYFDLITKYKLADPASVGWKDADATAAFAAGKAAMLPMLSPSAFATLDKSPLKGKYAFAPLPTVALGMSQRPANGKPAGSIVSGQNLAIASYTKNKDLALAFVELVTGTDAELARHDAFGDLPTTKDALAQLAKNNPALAPIEAIEKNATPTPFTGAWADVQNGMMNVVVQSLPSLSKGTYDATAIKALLDEANTKAQSALDRANK